MLVDYFKSILVFIQAKLQSYKYWLIHSSNSECVFAGFASVHVKFYAHIILGKV